MALFCVAIKTDSVSLFRFPLLSHFQVIHELFPYILAWRIHTIVSLFIFVFYIYLFCCCCCCFCCCCYCCSPSNYITHLRVFHTGICQWFLVGVWVTASLLEYPRLFSVFWSNLIMLLFVWSSVVILFSSPLNSLSILWRLYQAHQLQLISL